MALLAVLNSFLRSKMTVLTMMLFSFAVMTSSASRVNVSVEVYAGRWYNPSDGGCDGIGEVGFDVQPFVYMQFVSAIAFNEKTGDAYYALRDCSRIMLHNRISNNVTVMAGTIYRGDTGDGGPATEAMINHPVALTVDPDGQNLYFAEECGIIRRVDLTTQIITTAGGSSWRQGNDSDEEPFATAFIGNITDMYMNESRYMFVTDKDARVRLIDLWYGVVSTYAGVIGNRVIQDSATPLREAHFNQPGSLWGNKAGTEMIVYDTAVCWFRQIDMVAGTVSIWYDARSTCLRYDDNNQIVGMASGSQSDVRICGKDSDGNFYYTWRQFDTQRTVIQRFGSQGQHDTMWNPEQQFKDFTHTHWQTASCTVFNDTLYFTNNALGARVYKFSVSNETSAPSPTPTAAPSYGPTVIAPTAAPTCYWSGEEDSCGGELEEVSVSSSTSSVDTVTGTTVATTITRTYRKKT